MLCIQGQGQISIKMWQSGLDDIHGELTGLLREVEKGFNIGFSLFPELEKHLSREMQRVWGDQAGTSTRWAGKLYADTMWRA